MIDIVGTQRCQDGLPDIYDGELGLWKKTIEFYFSLEDIFLLHTNLYYNLNIIMLSVLIILSHFILTTTLWFIIVPFCRWRNWELYL